MHILSLFISDQTYIISQRWTDIDICNGDFIHWEAKSLKSAQSIQECSSKVGADKQCGRQFFYNDEQKECKCTFQGNSCDGFYRPGANGTQKWNWTKAFYIGRGNDF